MKTDSRIGGGSSAPIYRHPLLSCISEFLQGLADVPDPVARRRVRWTPLAASTAAVLMALDEESSLTGRFEHVHSCMKGDYRRGHRTGRTYNGVVKALERQQHVVLPLVKTQLREQVRQRLRRVAPVEAWLPLAVDGSKEALPRTQDHEAAFGIADNGHFPQTFVTAVVEVRTGLPWDWRIGAARASEKKHFLEMIQDLPDDALLLADAGFVGLPIWEKLCAKGQAFLIRVGGNVRLITDLWPNARTTQQRDLVYVWPKKTQATHAPLTLRLIRVGRGEKAVHLLTNVLEATRLSRKAAGALYRQRWGVELFYRTFKRTLGCAKLRSKAARRARIEFEWTLVAMTIATLLGIDAAVKRRRDLRRLSPAQLIRTLRRSLRADHRQRRATLERNLGNCLKDAYQRRTSKRSRYRITSTNTPTKRLQPPLVRKATATERREVLKYHPNIAA